VIDAYLLRNGNCIHAVPPLYDHVLRPVCYAHEGCAYWLLLTYHYDPCGHQDGCDTDACDEPHVINGTAPPGNG
jgi:hypothetical protein